MAEYFIIVVQICQLFLEFCRKSAISRIASSLNESKIHNYEEGLQRWAQLIKEEAAFLNAQTVKQEAEESSNFRARMAITDRKGVRYRRMKKRIQWLSPCSYFDHETLWKQARNIGSATVFLDLPGYQVWKVHDNSSTLVLSGTMGSGKTVIMANIVDDITISIPGSTVLYFFCRDDLPQSLRARTVFGSLAQQVTQRYVTDDTMDDIFTDYIPPVLDLSHIIAMLKNMVQRMAKVYLVLDGVDKCKEEEQTMIKQGLLELQENSRLMQCISLRTQANDPETKFHGWQHSWTINIPEDNPDVKEYIDSELQRRIKSKQLEVGNPAIVIDIRDALLEGAHGM